MNEKVLARRIFTVEDQHAFADASGDRNPMHLDAVAARRTQAGKIVVHGVHALLWSLEILAAAGDRPPASFRAQFLKFIYVGQAVELILAGCDAGVVEAHLMADGLTLTRISIDFESNGAAGGDVYRDFPEVSLGPVPQVLTIEEMATSHGWLLPPPGAVSIPGLFPALCSGIGTARVVALAQTSALIGMVCPGLHSIFSSLSGRIVDGVDVPPGIGWEARQPDKRYARINLGVAGSGIVAEVMALVRPAPVQATAIASLAPTLVANEFAGRRALVVGGSRGLGAATAKLLAAGGAQVTLTYARGRAEAEAVSDDIRSLCGEGAAIVVQCDIERPFDAVFLKRLTWATHIYYFATSQIGRQGVAQFTAERLDAFNHIFIDRFNDMVRSAVDGRPLNIFYPSTIFVEDRPKGMTEYAMSKAAAEILCKDLVRSLPDLVISAPRLPRVLTDQTAATIPVRTEDPAEVMLPLLRQERPAPPLS